MPIQQTCKRHPDRIIDQRAAVRISLEFQGYEGADELEEDFVCYECETEFRAWWNSDLRDQSFALPTLKRIWAVFWKWHTKPGRKGKE